MNYLNNIESGEVIRLIKRSDNGVYYSIFENKIYADNNLFAVSKVIPNKIDTITIESGGLMKDLNDFAALQLIAGIETDFIINNDEQNWNILTGSTGQDTTIRVTIPNLVYDKALMARDDNTNEYYPLWQVINYCQSGLPTHTANCTYNAMVQYLEELLPEHRQILEYYEKDGVIIEEKL